MSSQIFQAQVLIPGNASGRPLLLDEPLSLWGGLNPQTGEITDRRHPQSGEIVSDRVLILPAGRGSSSASSILLEAVKAETAPVAIITSELDGILALGAVVASEIYGQAPPLLVVESYDAFCQAIGPETTIAIKATEENGKIFLSHPD